MSPHTSATNRELPRATACAGPFGVYPSSRADASTRTRSVSVTLRVLPLTTRDAVTVVDVRGRTPRRGWPHGGRHRRRARGGAFGRTAVDAGRGGGGVSG